MLQMRFKNCKLNQSKNTGEKVFVHMYVCAIIPQIIKKILLKRSDYLKISQMKKII